MDKRWNISKYIVKQPMKKQEDNRDGYPLVLGARLGSGQRGTERYNAKYREQLFLG